MKSKPSSNRLARALERLAPARWWPRRPAGARQATAGKGSCAGRRDEAPVRVLYPGQRPRAPEKALPAASERRATEKAPAAASERRAPERASPAASERRAAEKPPPAAPRPRAAAKKERRRAGPHGRLRRNLAALAVLVLLLIAMAAGYTLTLHPVRVEIDGRTLVLRTHMSSIGEALAEARILLQPEDRVDPPPATPLQPGLRVRVQRARTLYITVDGEELVHRTLFPSVGEALTEAGVKWIPEDRITIGGQVVSGEQLLYSAPPDIRRTTSRGGRPAGLSAMPAAVRVQVQRALPIGVQDDKVPYTFLTTASTLGEALLEKGIILYAADRIEPGLDTPIRAGLHATIDRSRPVTLLCDGGIRQTRTRTQTVGELLREEGVTLGEQDYTRPVVDDPIAPGLRVAVVRVKENELVEQESIPFETQYRGNPTLEIDQQQVDSWGAPGILKRSLKVRYENGVEVSRSLAREWVEKPPQNRVISYGTRIVERTLVTPEGTFTYWRKLHVLATAYTAATCGKTRSDPAYGITRVGWKARKGIIATDPNVISMFTKLYAPGYGPGTAADTGSAIKGLHIDLCYDEDNFVDWWKWIDVYLLTPVPPRGQIKYILPSYPKER